MASYLAWMQYFSWFMYANEAMSIIQWEGVENISNRHLMCFYCSFLTFVSHQPATRQRFPMRICRV